MRQEPFPVDTGKVTHVLMADGWHEVVPGSMRAWPEVNFGRWLPQGIVMAVDVESGGGFSFSERFDDVDVQVVCAPPSILAVRMPG